MMYETILVPTDGSDVATRAGEHAVELASKHDATVHVLYVADVRMSPISSDMDEAAVRELVAESDEQPTADVVAMAERAGVPVVETLQIGVPHECIEDYVVEEGVDLVVMGTHGRTGIERVALGSVAERVVRTSPTPVLTVPPGGQSRDAE